MKLNSEQPRCTGCGQEFGPGILSIRNPVGQVYCGSCRSVQPTAIGKVHSPLRILNYLTQDEARQEIRKLKTENQGLKDAQQRLAQAVRESTEGLEADHPIMTKLGPFLDACDGDWISGRLYALERVANATRVFLPHARCQCELGFDDCFYVDVKTAFVALDSKPSPY